VTAPDDPTAPEPVAPDDAAPERSAPERSGPAQSGAARSPREQHPAESDALLSRLRVIESQPLESRADALTQLHDELRAVLEAGDSRRP